MSSENENKNIELSKEVKESVDETLTTEENIENQEETKEEKSEDKAKEEFISEFAPEPISIPNYNKEKALAKHEKKTAKKKKRNSKKSKKRRRLLRKIVRMIRNVFLFVLMIVVLTTTLSALIVKMSTSEYAVQSAIRTHEPETFVIGKIKNPLDMNLKQSSSRASLIDVIRDNSLLMVTYEDIRQAVMKSSYPAFVADKVYDVLQYYLYNAPYKEITRKEISDLILDNVSYIKLVTGQELGQSACDEIAKNIMKSSVIKELSEQKLEKQPFAAYTHITSVMLSLMAIICLLIAFVLLMVLIVASCNGYAQKMIGWAFMLSGAIISIFTAVRKLFFEPFFSPSAEFIKSVYAALSKSFVSSALVYGGITVLLGLIILLIGRVMNDGDEDDEIDEEDYIDEIEQVSTAQ